MELLPSAQQFYDHLRPALSWWIDEGVAGDSSLRWENTLYLTDK